MKIIVPLLAVIAGLCLVGCGNNNYNESPSTNAPGMESPGSTYTNPPGTNGMSTNLPASTNSSY